MDEIQKVVRRDFVVRHQPRKRGAVRVEVILLYAPRLHPVAVQKIGDEPAHALVDLREDIGLGRIERVVEVEYRSEEHTSELQSLMRISYAVFCLKKKIAE